MDFYASPYINIIFIKYQRSNPITRLYFFILFKKIWLYYFEITYSHSKYILKLLVLVKSSLYINLVGIRIILIFLQLGFIQVYKHFIDSKLYKINNPKLSVINAILNLIQKLLKRNCILYIYCHKAITFHQLFHYHIYFMTITPSIERTS